MRTILTHFYNEEYLLPWWLNHHKKYFEHGMLLNFGSTDRSIEIIKDICPTWQVLPSKFEKFDSHHLEWEMMGYERQIPGWRISIPVTEFLVGDISGLTAPTSERTQWIIPSLIFGEYAPDRELDTNKLLWEQCHMGLHYQDTAQPRTWQCRSMHNYNDIFYDGGRHFSQENTDKAMIFKFANVLVGEQMIKRKLQIQTKVAEWEKPVATTHCSVKGGILTRENLYENYKTIVGETRDCTDIMNSVLKFL